MDLDDYDDLHGFLTGDGRLWCTRTFASSLVYRYRSCLQDDASPAESQMTYASLMVHMPQSRMDITMTVSNDLCQSNGACASPEWIQR